MRWSLAGAALLTSAQAIQVTVTDNASLKSAASTVAFGLVKYYTGNETGDVAGNLPDPYFWWEAGAMFGTLVDYWLLTGDDSYNAITTQALVHQAGDDADFMPVNQTRTEGNDDQGFWALAAMSAAENNFPNPPADQPQWLALAQAVFNEYTTRWDTASCGGGLRWQIFQFNNGFTYKNSISNGCFFNLAARLARFTGNATYAAWAERVWDWEVAAGLITADYHVYDGASLTENCTRPDRVEWTYNAGIFLHGAAVMFNYTSDTDNNASDTSDTWQTRTRGVLAAVQAQFTTNGSRVLVETACETIGLCDNDQQSFKGYLLRWLAGTAQMAPSTWADIQPILQANAVAAGAACVGSSGGFPGGFPGTQGDFPGTQGTACGFRWTTGAFDGLVGVGEQMNALSALMYALVKPTTQAAVTSATGGTSVGNPDAGQKTTVLPTAPAIAVRDRVAAGFLTTAILLSVLGGSVLVVV